MQAVDARDMAVWFLEQARARTAGPVNVTAPPGSQHAGDLFAAAARVTGAGATPVWVPDEVLTAHGAEGWEEVPLWLPSAAFPGTFAVGTDRAQALGLRCRPLEETVADVWAWLQAGGEAELAEWSEGRRPRGMTAEREAALLAAAEAA
jgi:nucleoside-diphosphate-sugar epimerase